MLKILKKHTANLQPIIFILMMVIPFLLYYFARSGSTAGMITFLAAMGVVMLATMKP